MKYPLIVAELSCNHRGSLNRALRLVNKCAEAGAGAIKLQTWTPGTMVLDPSLVIESGPWAGRNMQELYAEAHTPWEWHPVLFDYAKKCGIFGFSSVFDLRALEFLESIDCPMYKISSFDCTDLQLIKAVANTGKSMVISTGMASWDEIWEAVVTARAAGCKELTLLKCSSAYPAPLKGCNLSAMQRLSAGGNMIGFSDHTVGISAAISASALGAQMIEKHVRESDDDDDEGLDYAFSIDPDELADMVLGCWDAVDAVGEKGQEEVAFGVSRGEEPQALLRKSLYVIKDISAGDVLTIDNVGSARPAVGLHCREFDNVIGKRCAVDISAGTPLLSNMLI
jgi:pseudaminic acid synthase